MSKPEQVYGIGRSRIEAGLSTGRVDYTINLPLTGEGGFKAIWDDESFMQRFIELDISSRSIEEIPVIINGFGNFFLDWSNLPMPYSFVSDLVRLWNDRDRCYFAFVPKYEDLIGTPELKFPVNIIGAEGLEMNTSDSIYSRGTFGLKLHLRTRKNSKVIIAQAQGVLPGGGSYSAPREGQGLT